MKKRSSVSKDTPALFDLAQVQSADLEVAASADGEIKEPKEKLAKRFFTAQRAHSELKAKILEKYVPTWAGILIGKRFSDRVLYIDLFSGPGFYEDGSASTPILVLRQLVDNPSLHASVITYFSDADGDNVEALRAATSGLTNIQLLKYAPIVEKAEVTPESHLQFAKLSLVPALLFFDPFGYKTLSANMIQSILKNPGSTSAFSSLIIIELTQPLGIQ